MVAKSRCENSPSFTKLVSLNEKKEVMSPSWEGVPDRNLRDHDSQPQELNEIAEGSQHGWCEVTHRIPHKTD
jgi:hypothetical protein